MNDGVENWLLARARQTPDRMAIHCDSEQLTFAELLVRSDEVASRLLELGVRPADRIGLINSGLSFVISLHALSRIGAVATPMNTRLRSQEYLAQLHEVDATGILCSPDDDASPAFVRSNAVLGGPSASIAADIMYLPLAPAIRHEDGKQGFSESICLDDLHSIIFTSGTTGRGKGVRLTYGNHWWNAMGSAINLGTGPDDIWLNSLPLYHVGGLAILLRSVLDGSSAIVHPRFDPAAVNDAIDHRGVTMVSLVSTMLYRVLDLRAEHRFPNSLRCILLGGGPIPAPLIETCMRQDIPIAPTYGLTETASQATTLRPEEVHDHASAAGRPLLGVEVSIGRRAGEDSGSEDDGEIVLRGPAVSGGYIGGDAKGREDGWFYTGDLGELDEAGYLRVAGRRIDRIVTGGENVNPIEVESVLASHPDVVDVGVFPIEDPEWGEIVAAAIVPRHETLSIASVSAFCRDRLAHYKSPKRIFMVSSLPRTPSGKLLRRELAGLHDLADSTTE